MALCFYIIKCLLPHLSAAKAESHEPPHCLPNQILTDELAGEMAQQHLLVRNHNMQTPLQQRYVQWAAEPYGKGHAVGRGVRIQLVQQDHDLLVECAVHSASLLFGGQDLGAVFCLTTRNLTRLSSIARCCVLQIHTACNSTQYT